MSPMAYWVMSIPLKPKQNWPKNLRAKFLGPTRPSLNHEYSFGSGQELKDYLEKWAQANSFVLPNNPAPASVGKCVSVYTMR